MGASVGPVLALSPIGTGIVGETWNLAPPGPERTDPGTAAVVVIRSAADGSVVRRIRSSPGGGFTAPVPSGSYDLSVSMGPAHCPDPIEVRVPRAGWMFVRVKCSG